jgi:pyruvate dehydrogenase E2 component (dihydrolipoamide acetyltransferase)
MASEILMPKLSDTMTEGQLGAWRKSVGEVVERGDIVAEIETDKAVMELEAFATGILLEQRIRPGELVAVGTVIGLIGTPGELTQQQQPLPSPPPEKSSIPEIVPAAVQSTPAPAREPVEQAVPDGTAAAPVVRRRAAELGIDLHTVKGSGPGGRIMLDDLQQLAPAVGNAVSSTGPGVELAEPQVQSRMRSAIARTTTSSWQTIPHFYLSREIAMATAEQFVNDRRSAGVKISLNALIMAAVIRALQRFPELNAAYGETGIIRHPHINLGFAVALAEGLQVPVIRESENMNLAELTAAAAILAERARQGVLRPEEITGGSFSVSNLGMYGVDSLASIIMPGQAGILALGAVADRPTVQEGKLAVTRMMTATLSCDHRLIDGISGAAFLNECKRLLENPQKLPQP